MIISGQKFVPSNVHNLAQYEDQWTSEIYDLRSWYDGYCHTFDPKETQRRSLASKLSLFLGHRELLNNYKGIMFKQFTLVLKKRFNINYNTIQYSSTFTLKEHFGPGIS